MMKGKSRQSLDSGIFAALEEAAVEVPAVTEAPPSKPKRGRPMKGRIVSHSERPDREGRKPLPFWTTEAAKIQLKVLAAQTGTTQQELMTKALNLLFRNQGLPPIA